MKNNWDFVRLGSIAEFRNGVNFDNSSFGNGLKVINVADFKNRMYPDYESLGELDSNAKWPKECFLKNGDVIFVRSNGNKALIGRSIFIKDLPQNYKLTYSAFCIKLSFIEDVEIEPLFYLYVFKSPLFRGLLSQYGNGTNISNLNQDILNNIKVPVTNLIAQQKIASILSAYDDLIENNNERIKLLEEMAEEIYKEWFVRLRFPGYQDCKYFDQDGKEVPHGTAGALPEGWEAGEIQDFVELKKGKIITKSTITDGNVPVVAGGLAPAYYHNTANTCSPTITISSSGANAGFVNLYYEDIWVSDCTYLDSEMTHWLYFFYCTFKTRQKEVFHLQRGAAQPHVYSKDIHKLKMKCPPKKILNEFEDLISPFFEDIKVLNNKNQLLQETRDLLLPRLISGKLSVEDLDINKDSLPMAAEPEENYSK
ncbi:restriction endonuclease subunit S [Flavobacteriaceae bacterium F89]|uniref:Restriction endonuclease subunit S n=1 Tax=Cerina litoralis TaxID=2874477 RepID=A0AAE3ETH1_9FLAO|nr:restriction endonuclease subunit S [Cerina litoralis]MCG2460835.1 restriction endonuclease subunit S [Cerina litoralis]